MVSEPRIIAFASIHFLSAKPLDASPWKPAPSITEKQRVGMASQKIGLIARREFSESQKTKTMPESIIIIMLYLLAFMSIAVPITRAAIGTW